LGYSDKRRRRKKQNRHICAHGMQGDTAKAKAAYQDFLMLWKNADPDIPILKQAKAEYAKLQ
jgi:eukaryotic-like serine/threonine-protein kinase